MGDRVRWRTVDLASWEPEEAYDLVTSHYAHPAIAQLECYDRLASWVAPRGTLVVVGHLHTHADVPPGHHHPGPDAGAPAGPPGSASVTAAALTARLDPAVWQVVTAAEPQRSATGRGRAVVIHDVVVRATRRD